MPSTDIQLLAESHNNLADAIRQQAKMWAEQNSAINETNQNVKALPEFFTRIVDAMEKRLEHNLNLSQLVRAMIFLLATIFAVGMWHHMDITNESLAAMVKEGLVKSDDYFAYINGWQQVLTAGASSVFSAVLTYLGVSVTGKGSYRRKTKAAP